MQKISYILLLITLIGFTDKPVWAQDNIEFLIENFPNQKKEFRYHKAKLKTGYKLFEKKIQTGDKQFNPVLAYLLPAYKFNPFNELLNFRIGYCYFRMDKKEEALSYFSNASYLESPHDPRLLLWLGICEYQEMLWENAYEHISEYLKNNNTGNKNDSLANVYLEKSRIGKIMASNPVNTRIEKMALNLNEEGDKTFPFLSADESILFYNLHTTDSNGKKIIKILYSQAIESKWDSPKLLPMDNYASLMFEAVNISNDNNKMLLRTKSKSGNWDLYESNYLAGKWSNPVLLSSYINTVDDEVYACYGPGDSSIFYISNRSGGLGGFDIWRAERDASGWYINATNMGDVINSSANEYTIHFPQDYQVAFMTSDGHGALGDADIFRLKSENGTWTTVVSIGYPINTTRNEANFYVLPNGQKAILSGKRSSSDLQDDLYLIQIPPKIKMPGIIREERIFSGYPVLDKFTWIVEDE
ncbi:MAG: hypothetical protein LC101_04605 [Flavobacteriales bacterium]|nr:hypothetical protein [Flavobacteriales bacterium]